MSITPKNIFFDRKAPEVDFEGTTASGVGRADWVFANAVA